MVKIYGNFWCQDSVRGSESNRPLQYWILCSPAWWRTPGPLAILWQQGPAIDVQTDLTILSTIALLIRRSIVILQQAPAISLALLHTLDRKMWCLSRRCLKWHHHRADGAWGNGNLQSSSPEPQCCRDRNAALEIKYQCNEWWMIYRYCIDSSILSSECWWRKLSVNEHLWHRKATTCRSSTSLRIGIADGDRPWELL